jgi:hypothetical protein
MLYFFISEVNLFVGHLNGSTAEVAIHSEYGPLMIL